MYIPLLIVALTDSNADNTPLFNVVWISLLVAVVIASLGYILIRWYFHTIRYEILEDEVHVYRGIITQTRKIVPYRTITNLDVKRGPYDRFFNLGTIEIQTAGNSANKMGPEEKIDGIQGDLVEGVQEELINKVRKMRGSAGVTHDLPDEESLLAEILYQIKELRKQLVS